MIFFRNYSAPKCRGEMSSQVPRSAMSITAPRTDAKVVATASVEQMRGRLRTKSQLKGRQPDHAAMA